MTASPVSLEVVLLEGPPYAGKEGYWDALFASTHAYVSAWEVYNEQGAGTGLRAVVREIVAHLASGRSVAVDDDQLSLPETRKSYVESIRSRAPRNATISFACVALRPTGGLGQCAWLYHWNAARRYHQERTARASPIQQQQFAAPPRAVSKPLLPAIQWYDRRHKPPIAELEHTFLDAVEVVPMPLVCRAAEAVGFPALFIEWNAMVHYTDLATPCLYPGVAETIREWAAANSSGFVCVVGHHTGMLCDLPGISAVAQGTRAWHAALSSAVGALKGLASESPDSPPIFFCFMAPREESAAALALPFPGPVVFLASLLSIKLADTSTLYIYRDKDTGAAGGLDATFWQNLGLRSLRASHAWASPKKVKAVRSAVEPTFEFVKTMVIEEPPLHASAPSSFREQQAQVMIVDDTDSPMAGFTSATALLRGNKKRFSLPCVHEDALQFHEETDGHVVGYAAASPDALASLESACRAYIAKSGTASSSRPPSAPPLSLPFPLRALSSRAVSPTDVEALEEEAPASERGVSNFQNAASSRMLDDTGVESRGPSPPNIILEPHRPRSAAGAGADIGIGAGSQSIPTGYQSFGLGSLLDDEEGGDDGAGGAVKSDATTPSVHSSAYAITHADIEEMCVEKVVYARGTAIPTERIKEVSSCFVESSTPSTPRRIQIQAILHGSKGALYKCFATLPGIRPFSGSCPCRMAPCMHIIAMLLHFAKSPGDFAKVEPQYFISFKRIDRSHPASTQFNDVDAAAPMHSPPRSTPVNPHPPAREHLPQDPSTSAFMVPLHLQEPLVRSTAPSMPAQRSPSASEARVSRSSGQEVPQIHRVGSSPLASLALAEPSSIAQGLQNASSMPRMASLLSDPARGGSVGGQITSLGGQSASEAPTSRVTRVLPEFFTAPKASKGAGKKRAGAKSQASRQDSEQQQSLPPQQQPARSLRESVEYRMSAHELLKLAYRIAGQDAGNEEASLSRTSSASAPECSRTLSASTSAPASAPVSALPSRQASLESVVGRSSGRGDATDEDMFLPSFSRQSTSGSSLPPGQGAYARLPTAAQPQESDQEIDREEVATTSKALHGKVTSCASAVVHRQQQHTQQQQQYKHQTQPQPHPQSHPQPQPQPHPQPQQTPKPEYRVVGTLHAQNEGPAGVRPSAGRRQSTFASTQHQASDSEDDDDGGFLSSLMSMKRPRIE